MLDDRKSAILRAVVRQYIETAQPVGSSSVAARAEVNVSSATVRNEMTVLEDDGFLFQPHRSAGRIPTEKGYRHFVDNLSGDEPLSPANVRLVAEFFNSAHGEIERMLSDTTSLLSSITGTAAVVVGEATNVTTVRSVQLVELSQSLVLVVVVLSNGAVLKRTLDLTDPVDAEVLHDAQTMVLATVVDRSIEDLSKVAIDGQSPASVVANAALDELRTAVEVEARQVFVDGRAHIAGSFDARETVEAVLGILEQQLVVVSLLKELVDSGIAVSIGSESGVARLSECSLVVAPYRLGDESAGAIAVVGPTRMNYPETLSAVAVVSRRLSNLLSEG